MAKKEAKETKEKAGATKKRAPNLAFMAPMQPDAVLAAVVGAKLRPARQESCEAGCEECFHRSEYSGSVLPKRILDLYTLISHDAYSKFKKPV